VGYGVLLNPFKEDYIMKTSLKISAHKSAPLRVPSDSPLVTGLQYLMSVVLVLALAGLGVWLQHAMGSHSQGPQELSAQAAVAPQLKYDDEGDEMPPIPDSFDIEPVQPQQL
jgi:hypothetical protein